ncbi:fungal-specific transcription factor domain-containing protein [Rhodocollybia butyracea]|uniref:Fungal-specific transcription factor domain-containing protein n=1 Tax=Rhodocollybia butyracea TaxID=206335 RepID=A0A9P5UFI2_9AGAR|nr:fungal-specific transcription factor domain-containing protein [Rhodocollybia butyracea]
MIYTDQHWPEASSSHHRPNANDGSFTNNIGLQYAMSFSDDYDDISEVTDGLTGLGRTNESGSSAGDKAVKRRSSKACDQCRKSKCRCERSSPNEPCRNCVMLGTPCTFLGPSRKRGPPKGYIDAIEARLHQAEALVGIMLALAPTDSRAETLLSDIAQDPLAKEIIKRINNSPYGVKGRGESEGDRPKTRQSPVVFDDNTKQIKAESASNHPSNEWQDRVTAMLRTASRERFTDAPSQSQAPPLSAYSDTPGTVDRSLSPGRRQRRKVADMPGEGSSHNRLMSTSAPATVVSTPVFPSSRYGVSSSGSSRASSPRSLRPLAPTSPASNPNDRQVGMYTSGLSDGNVSGSDEDEFAGAMGQLSLNEDKQVRYHGKASGLHLLGAKERVDSRNEGGIWRFPKARVWPPLPLKAPIMLKEQEGEQLPPAEIQEHLLTVYFKHVHPFLPVVHKRAFYQALQADLSPENSPVSTSTPESERTSNLHKHRRVPPMLLFAMFAIASRYSNHPSNVPRPSSSSTMWGAGDIYLERAQNILDRSYVRSCPSTCQALLLLGYREVGIGAMASAWTYVGMAIRMAQDLGMYRSADGWARAELGGRIFGATELQERRRIWYACVLMDKYISAYIGRPLMISERDFDTPLPDDKESEDGGLSTDHVIPCFNAAAVLSGILSMIIQAIYAVRPVSSSRHEEAIFLEGILDKWYYGLPVHLQHDTQSFKTQTPPAHVLTLHMQYWCTVLLLHRPFIRHGPHTDEKLHHTSEISLSEKSYELCASAANHITSTVSLYLEKYTLERCPAFLCYYVFSASIMHIISISAFPGDPQARIALQKCFDALSAMQVVWPSSTRALELLQGSKIDITAASPLYSPQRRKRSWEHTIGPNVQVQDDYTQAPLRLETYGLNQYQNHSTYPSPTMDVGPVGGFQKWPEYHFDSTQITTYPLSTSVLPQTFGTELIEDRQSSMGYRSMSSAPNNINNSRNPNPQYWNDFSVFPQLQNYNNVPPHGINAHSMFLSKPYNNAYNNEDVRQ